MTDSYGTYSSSSSDDDYSTDAVVFSTDDDVVTYGSRFSAKYHMTDEVLGKGAFSTVKVAQSLRSGETFAVKIVDKTDGKMSLAEMQKEVEFMRKLRHPNIVSFVDVFETKTKLLIVSERLQGGEFLERLLRDGSYTEAMAAGVIRQLVTAVQYLHANGIVHRDLKPDNILLVRPDSDFIKLTDFGLSGELNINGRRVALTQRCGTTEYCAPEVLNLKVPYDEMCDWWSVGVILYVTLIGKFPFYERDKKHPGTMERDIAAGRVVFPKDAHLSSDAQDLIKRLLVVNPNKRLTGSGILKHKWMKTAATKKAALSHESKERLRGFMARRRFFKGVNVVRGVYRFRQILSKLQGLKKSLPPSPPALRKYKKPVAIITGASKGIGFEAARQLVSGYHLILCSRSRQDGMQAVDRIKAEHGADVDVEWKRLDLADYDNIYNFVKHFRVRNLPLKLLVNNASVLHPPKANTEDGLQTAIKVNMLGPFLLTYLLQDVLKRSPGRSRIVNVVSSDHGKAGRMTWDEVQNVPHSAADERRAYFQSKLSMMIFTFEQARRLNDKGVDVNCWAPRRTKSTIGSSFLFMSCTAAKTADSGADLAEVCASDQLENVTGTYMEGTRVRTPSSNATNVRDGQRLWNECAKRTDCYTWVEKLDRAVVKALGNGASTASSDVLTISVSEASSSFISSSADSTIDDTSDDESDSDSSSET